MLQNGDFELGHVDHTIDDTNIQIPRCWTLHWASPDTPNPYDDAQHSRFNLPEIRVLHRNDLPPHEHDDYILSGDHCLKVFRSHGSWSIKLSKDLDLDEATYRLTLNIYADLIDHYLCDEKQPPDDPLSGIVQVSLYDIGGMKSYPRRDFPQFTLKPLQQNQLTFDFNAEGHTALDVNIMCPFPLENSGIFADAWTLHRTGDVPSPPEPRSYHRVAHLLPQDATDDEVAQVLEAAIPNKQTITWSLDDAVITHPNLETRTVHAWEVERTAGTETDFETWIEDYYPPRPAIIYHSFAPDPSPIPTPDPPPAPSPPPPAGPLLTLHVQTDVTGLPAFIAQAQPAWVKLVGNAELAQTIKHISPDTKILYRHHLNHQAPYLEHPDPHTAACNFLDRFWDAIEANAIDCVEGLNETIATGDTDGIMRAVAFEVALSNEVKRRSLGQVAACLLNTAVGNPAHGMETELLLPVAEAAHHNNHYIGYHPYFPARHGYTQDWILKEGKHHHMRALLSWDPVFTAAGYHVRYLFTEAGACGAAARPDGRPGGYNFLAGWRHNDALSANWQAYLHLLLTFQALVTDWNATHDQRAEAIMLFTIGAPYVGWGDFKLWERELGELGEALK